MRRCLWPLVATLILLGCSEPDEQTGRCRTSPEVDGQRAASEALAMFILESQARQPAGTSLHELTAGIDADEVDYLGMPQTEPGDPLVYEFRAAGTQSPTFRVLVSADCRTEIHWY